MSARIGGRDVRPATVDGVEELVSGGVPGPAPGHPPHWHGAWQLVAVTRGDGWVRVRNTRHRTPAGSLFLIPPETVHDNGVGSEGCDFRSMLIDAEIVEGMLAATGIAPHRLKIAADPVTNCPDLERQFSAFHRALQSQDRGTLGLENELTNWMTGLIHRKTSQAPADIRPNQVSHPAARRAREYLWDRAADSISLAELAQEAGLSSWELNRQFKAAYGMPPHAWQLQARVERAKPLLRAGKAAGEVAVELGFSDQSHFGRVFRRSTGVSPAAFQSEFRKIVPDQLR